MGTLAGCLKQLGISGSEATEFKKLAKQYVAEGHGERSAERAVLDMIGQHRASRQQIVASIYEAAPHLKPSEVSKTSTVKEPFPADLEVPVQKSIPTKVQRIEEPDTPLGTTDKPHGLYTTPADVKSPHADLGGQVHTMDVNPSARVLSLEGEPATSGGITAFKSLVGDELFGAKITTVKGRARLDGFTKQSLGEKLAAEHPEVDWSRYYDQQEMLEGYAGIKAREAGYDAIWATDKDPAFSEFIGLSDKAFVKDNLPGVRDIFRFVREEQGKPPVKVRKSKGPRQGRRSGKMVYGVGASEVNGAKFPDPAIVRQPDNTWAIVTNYGRGPGNVPFSTYSEAKAAYDAVAAEFPKPAKAGGVQASAGGTGRMSKAMESEGGKPTTINDIRQHFEKSLKTPIRTGKYNYPGAKGAFGIYKINPDVIRLKDYGDVEVLSHEVAHAIENKEHLGTFLKQFKNELSPLDYEPGKGRVSEGFAEYLRHYMTGSGDAAAMAPKFTSAFEGFLDKTPELKQTISQGKSLFDSWRFQGAEARVKAAMVYTPPKGGIKAAVVNAKNWYLREFDDALTPIRHFTEAAEKVVGKKLRGAENPFELATAIKGTAPAKANAWFKDATLDFDGNPTGAALETIFKSVKNREEAAIEYAYAKHGVERWKQGKNPGSDLADLQYIIDKNKSPEFEKFSQDLSGYRDRLLQYVVDAGALDPATADLFRKTYQSSIPLYREGFEVGQPGMGGKKYGDLGQPTKRAHGSGRMVINPIAGLMKETERLISFADRARVGAAIADVADKSPGLGSWVEEVHLPAKVNKISAEQAIKNFKEAGIDIGDLDAKQLDKALTSFSQQVRGVPNENIVTFYKDGKLRAYQLNKDLYEGISQVNPWAATGFFKLLTIPKKVVAAGATGFRPSFGLLTNALRDPWSAMMQSRMGKTTVFQSFGGTLRVAAHKLGLGSEGITRWKRVGGEQAQFFNAELPKAMENAKRIIADNQRSKAMNIVRHPVELYREILNTPEAGPRSVEFNGVYDRVLKETGDPRTAWIEALNASKNVTMNFGRAGRTGSVINQFVPFFNPAIQEPGLIARSFRRNPMGTMAKGVAGLTVPTIALWYMNKDEDWYKATPTWEKATFWHFKIGDNVWRLPKPFLWGAIFASWPESVLNQFEQQEPGAVAEMSKQLALNTVPNLIPPFVSVPFALGAGEEGYDTFRGRPIVSQSQMNLPPAERFGNYTTETAKAIGRTLNVAPSKVDYAIGGFTGGLGTDIIQAAESPFTNKAASSGLPGTPMIGRLVSYPPFVNKFYDEYTKLQETDKGIKLKTEKDRTVEEKATHKKAKDYAGVAEKLSALRKKITLVHRSSLSSDVKGAQIDDLKKQMEAAAHDLLYGGKK